MTQLMPFAFEDNLVRIVKLNGEPWFVGKDICEVLSIRDYHQALERLDPDERGGCTVPTPQGEQSMIVVSEPGVFRLIFTSRKPEAERFKRWLAHDVLPALRRNGSYTIPGREGSPPYDFPSEPVLLQAYGLKLETVRQTLRVHGIHAARSIWNALGLPPVPGFEPVRSDEAERCLAHLLGTKMHTDRTLGQWIAVAIDCEPDSETRRELKFNGILILDDGDAELGFIVANTHTTIAGWFAGTPWKQSYPYVLRRLPGVRPYKPMHYGMSQRRGTFIPATFLEPAPVPPPSNVVPLH